MSRPLKVQIVERARQLIADEENWCQRHLALDVKWRCRVANFCRSVNRCGLGAVIAAAYQLTYDYDAGHRLGHEALRPHYSPATLIYLNDIRGHAAVLALFDEVIAAG